VRISIRYQILGLTVGVLGVAITAYFVLANHLFARDKLAYIYDLEASLTTTVAEEVRASLGSRVDKLGWLALAQAQGGDERAARMLLASDPDLLSVEIWEPRGGRHVQVFRLTDPERLAALNLSSEDIDEARRSAPVPFEAVAEEGALLQNASLPPDVGILSLAAPAPEGNRVVVALLRPDRLLRIFARSPAWRVYLVDGRGGIVVHPDPARVVARQSMESIPVVKEAIRGTVARGVHEFAGPEGSAIGAFARVGMGRLAVVAEVPMAVALEASRQLARRTLLFGVGILFLAVFASVLLGRRLTAPLRRLELATQAVARGEYASHVEVAQRNEIGSLADAFNRMSRELADREARLAEAHTQLAQSEKLSVVGEIGASVAHEVKNPLAGIVGYAQLGQSSETLAQARESLKLIEGHAWRASEILQSLLEFSRLDQVEYAPVDAVAVAEGALRLLRHVLMMRQIRVETAFAPGLPPVLGNAGQLQQVFVNLVMNASQAMEDRPERVLSLGATLEGDGVSFTVRDTGTGMAPDVLEKIFAPFFTTKPRGQGTGLGLSVSRTRARPSPCSSPSRPPSRRHRRPRPSSSQGEARSRAGEERAAPPRAASHAECPRRSRHVLRLHPQDHAEAAALGHRGVARGRVHLGGAEPLQDVGDRTHPVAALDEERLLGWAVLHAQPLRGVEEGRRILGDDVHLRAATSGRERGERDEVHLRVLQLLEEPGPLTRLVGHLEVEVLDAADPVGHVTLRAG
jgi:two-component system, NtrC family, sensor kinase